MTTILLTTIGSRGDVQPLVALALRLRESGHQARLCVPPDFRDWVVGLGFPVTPIGPRLEGRMSAQPSSGPGQASIEWMQRRAEAMIADQFTTITEAGQGCDAIVAAAGRLLVGAPSAAQALGIRYVFATFYPSSLQGGRAGRLNEVFGSALNRFRTGVGLAAVEDVRAHVFTQRPWLAADPVLAPWLGPADAVWQTGPWVLPDERPLDPELEAFLAAGEPPVYFGFGSMRMPPELAQVVVAAARSAGRRAIIAAGWAGLTPPGGENGCLGIGEVNQQALFSRVAAVVHHGGAGTTTAAALAEVPQVIIPQAYDQPYWAQRVTDLGIGTACPPSTQATRSQATRTQDAGPQGVGTPDAGTQDAGTPEVGTRDAGTPDAGIPDAVSLADALDRVLQPAMAARAQALRPALRTTGAHTAAANLTTTATATSLTTTTATATATATTGLTTATAGGLITAGE
jgi:vancomycin aglycone glucosyltransferase